MSRESFDITGQPLLLSFHPTRPSVGDVRGIQIRTRVMLGAMGGDGYYRTGMIAMVRVR